MMKYLIATFIVLTATTSHAAPCVVSEPYPYVYNKDIECPADILDYLERTAGCQHFAGEEAYDEERGAYIAKQMDELQCGTLDETYRNVFLKHEGDLGYLGMIHGFHETYQIPIPGEDQ